MTLLGFSYLQLGWFFGAPSFGGFVLTPSSYPYIPPLSFIVTVPSDTCNGWSIKLIPAYFFGAKVYIPDVHFFSNGYEFFNAYVIGPNIWQNLYLYYLRLVDPVWEAIPAEGDICVAHVVFFIPGPVVVAIMVLALWIKLYIYHRRVW